MYYYVNTGRPSYLPNCWGIEKSLKITEFNALFGRQIIIYPYDCVIYRYVINNFHDLYGKYN